MPVEVARGAISCCSMGAKRVSFSADVEVVAFIVDDETPGVWKTVPDRYVYDQRRRYRARMKHKVMKIQLLSRTFALKVCARTDEDDICFYCAKRMYR